MTVRPLTLLPAEPSSANASIDTIIGALLLSLGRLIIDEIGTHRFGVGRHFWDIPPDRFNGFLTVRKFEPHHIKCKALSCR